MQERVEAVPPSPRSADDVSITSDGTAARLQGEGAGVPRGTGSRTSCLHARGVGGPKPLDIRRIVEALERRGVDYLLVGGVAATAHGAERLTADTDTVVRRTTVNLEATAPRYETSTRTSWSTGSPTRRPGRSRYRSTPSR